MRISQFSEVIIVGGGLAALSAASRLAQRSILIIREAGQAASLMARGGVAVAIGEDDGPALHGDDTLLAGAGICQEEMVSILVHEGIERVIELYELGVAFDRDGAGRLHLGREALHSRHRIVHAAGDSTGDAITKALIHRVAHDSDRVRVVEGRAADLIVDQGRVVGVVYLEGDGEMSWALGGAVVLATGGVGQLYRNTTNPSTARGDGLAMAARAGAALADLEFVQFHPTALAVDDNPMPLLSEAIRGEGGILVDDTGKRFMEGVHPAAELAGRDVVARAVWERTRHGQDVFLDVTGFGAKFADRFPAAWQACRQAGIDVARELIPVAPAAHYHMGGVATDQYGRTSLPGLWACGEVASNGVHGANRLASNSLLEALVFGARAGVDIDRQWLGPRGIALKTAVRLQSCWQLKPRSTSQDRLILEILRDLMWEHVGICRDEQGLQIALGSLARLMVRAGGPQSLAGQSLLVATMIAEAAKKRRESRGAHQRLDYPDLDSRYAHRSIVPGVSNR
jgi:L-aspartate oxidase